MSMIIEVTCHKCGHTYTVQVPHEDEFSTQADCPACNEAHRFVVTDGQGRLTSPEKKPGFKAAAEKKPAKNTKTK